jgi:hypothetical protein
MVFERKKKTKLKRITSKTNKIRKNEEDFF